MCVGTHRGLVKCALLGLSPPTVQLCESSVTSENGLSGDAAYAELRATSLLGVIQRNTGKHFESWEILESCFKALVRQE